jgi:hypothetical protein
MLIPWKSPDDDQDAISVHRLDIWNCKSDGNQTTREQKSLVRQKA